ncbi:hypothetical protein BJV82DRAFT_415882 [Fennellomyces sp. T-0311]|nr:hypothetical protein BJV82DRAFT_415882 [Fennellomyces sp. T-0311]
MGWLRKTQPPVEVQLPERDARILAKYEYRAKQFDEMFKLCCCWIGYDVLLDFIPIVGKVISLGFSLSMYRLACGCDLPSSLRRTMLYHISVDFVLGMIPILGILLTALYRANTKNARLLRRFLYQRASQQQLQPSRTSPPAFSSSSNTAEIQKPAPTASFASAPPALPPREFEAGTNPPPTPPRGDSSGAS